MKDFTSLKLLDRFKPLFLKSGVDYETMRSILRVKLTMDTRRTTTIMTANGSGEGKDNSFASTLFLYGLFGAFTVFFIFSGLSMFASMSFVFGLILFIVLTTMIGDFSSVLLDVRDKNLLASKPIDMKTINAAKIMHILIYIFKITAALSALTLIAGSIKFGILFGLLFLISLILISLFVIFLSSLLYSLILRFFDGEKLKDMINYFQIILSFFMIIGYQLIGDMFKIVDKSLNFVPSWWVYLMPPAWFSAPFEMFLGGNYSIPYIILSILAVLVPLVSLLIHFKFVIPNFEKNLSKLNNSTGIQKKSTKVALKLQNITRNLLCKNQTEKSFYTFTQKMASRERGIKLRLYPSLGFAVIFPFVMLFRNSIDNAGLFSRRGYLLIYMTIVLLSPSILAISQSENYKGGWIYKTLPIESLSSILKGSFKGFAVKYMLTIYAFTSIAFIFIFGVSIIPDLLIILVAMFFLTLISLSIAKKKLPFSIPFKTTKDGEPIGSAMLIMVVGAILSAIHYFLIKTLVSRLIFSAILIAVIFVLWINAFNTSWKDIG